MTVWFVIPVDRETEFRTLYANNRVRGRDNPNEDERIGHMMPDRTGTWLMTGTSRMSEDIRRALQGRRPAWLEIFTEFPPPSAWEPPVPLSDVS